MRASTIPLPGRLTQLFIAMALVPLATTLLVYWMGLRVTAANRAAIRNQEVIAGVEELLATVTDAETGQRGFLLTGDEQYLQPYDAAAGHVDAHLKQLKDWVAAGDVDPDLAQAVDRLAREKLAELKQTIETRRQSGEAAVSALVRSNLGKHLMDDLRDKVEAMQQQERAELLVTRRERDAANRDRTLVTAASSLLMLGFLFWAMRRIRREMASALRQKEAAQANERRYSALFANKINGMAHCRIITDAQGRPVDYTILQINEAYERIIGVKKAEVEGRRVTEVFPEIRSYAIDYIGMYGKLALEGGEIQFEEFFEASGQYLSIYAYSPMPGEFIAIFTDVTQRKGAEEALAANLDAMTRLQQIGARFVKAGQLADVLGEIVDAAITIVHADMGNIQLVDRQSGCLKIAAFRGFEQPFLDFWNAVAEGQGACGTAMRNAARTVVEDVAQSPIFVGTPALEVQLAAGVRAVQSTPLFGHSGDLIGMMSTHWHVPHRPQPRELHLLDLLAQQAVDIIELAHAEETLAAAQRQVQSIIDNTTAVIYAFDLEERFLLANTALAALLNSTPEQMIGKRRHEFMPKDDAEWHEANDRQAIEAGRALEFEEYSQLKGRSITWLTTKFPLRDGQGRIYAVGGISADVSERKKAEDELKAAKISAEQAKSAAEHASKAKDHFLAVLSHELRNPLNPVLATASMLLQDSRFDADTREQLEVIHRNAELEARLIDDLLDVTRIERGKVELDRQPIELGSIIGRAVEVCLPDIQARKLEFGVEAPDGPYWVHADAARLQQVFWNLLRNSIKFTPQGGCVGIRCRRDDDGMVLVEVSDSGAGIEAEAMGRIFNAFEQAERSTTREFGGLGLGLAISKSIVEMHGGSIHAYSQGKGKGATFRVRLALLPEQTGSELGNVPSSAVVAAASPRKLRILLVEDHGDTARIMRRLLSAGGHDVQHAADVATALTLAEKQTFDLLLSDLGLPDGSGVDLMRTLRARGLSLPGIALSGYGQDQDVQQCREAGFAQHLVKPVNLSKLAEAIANLVGDGTAVAGGANG